MVLMFDISGCALKFKSLRIYFGTNPTQEHKMENKHYRHMNDER